MRESEERLRVALWAAELLCWEWDVAAAEVRVVGSLGTVAGGAGAAPRPLVPAQLTDLHPDDRAAVTRAERWTRDEGADYDVEFRVPAPDGAERWLHQRGRVVAVDADGRAIRVAGVVQDVTERRRLVAELAHRATHDPLTDLPNRGLFLERLAGALDRAPRTRGVAVLLLDLDGFKGVNDRFGHETGDRLLVAVGERLRAGLRAEATVARLGGDEFALLLEDIEGAEAVGVARRAGLLLGRPFGLGHEEVRIGASLGLAVDGTGATEPRDLLRAADAALYRAKATRGGYVVAGSDRSA